MTSRDVHENAAGTNGGDKKCVRAVSASQKYQIETQSIWHYLLFVSGDQTSLSHWLWGRREFTIRRGPIQVKTD